MYLQNAPIYYDKYKKEESEIKALMELIKGVAEVTATEKNVNMSSVTLEYCFGGEETTTRKKIPKKKELHERQDLLNDTFAVKRYGKMDYWSR